jgi:hypothetical protein
MPVGGACWAAAAWACWAQQEESAEPQEEEEPAEPQPDEDAIHSQRDSKTHYTTPRWVTQMTRTQRQSLSDVTPYFSQRK